MNQCCCLSWDDIKLWNDARVRCYTFVTMFGPTVFQETFSSKK